MAEGNPELAGENTIDHTSKNERIKIYTGNALDLW
jgi:hypothetical protein